MTYETERKKHGCTRLCHCNLTSQFPAWTFPTNLHQIVSNGQRCHRCQEDGCCITDGNDRRQHGQKAPWRYVHIQSDYRVHDTKVLGKTVHQSPQRCGVKERHWSVEDWFQNATMKDTGCRAAAQGKQGGEGWYNKRCKSQNRHRLKTGTVKGSETLGKLHLPWAIPIAAYTSSLMVDDTELLSLESSLHSLSQMLEPKSRLTLMKKTSRYIKTYDHPTVLKYSHNTLLFTCNYIFT